MLLSVHNSGHTAPICMNSLALSVYAHSTSSPTMAPENNVGYPREYVENRAMAGAVTTAMVGAPVVDRLAVIG